MANCKAVHITARVPFHWAGDLTPEEAQCWCGWVLAPSTGLELNQEPAGYVPSEHGGRTMTYRLTLTGEEAIRVESLAVIADSLRRLGDEVIARTRDLENNTDWWTIQTVEEVQEMNERVWARFTSR